jgi:hypothetical protein
MMMNFLPKSPLILQNRQKNYGKNKIPNAKRKRVIALILGT